MKRMTMIVLSALVLFVGTAFTVEKKEKPKPVPPVKVQQPQAKKVVPPPPAGKTAKPAAKNVTTKPAEKKYDDFIDLNHNGIDDRQENLVKKEAK